jgi:hypothetical protein
MNDSLKPMILSLDERGQQADNQVKQGLAAHSAEVSVRRVGPTRPRCFGGVVPEPIIEKSEDAPPCFFACHRIIVKAHWLESVREPLFAVGDE